jgi:hypothetical protein
MNRAARLQDRRMLEVSGCIEPLGGWPAADDGGRRVAEDTRRPPGARLHRVDRRARSAAKTPAAKVNARGCDQGCESA